MEKILPKILPILPLLFVLTITPAIANQNKDSGKSNNQLTQTSCDPDDDWKNHGEYVSCVAHQKQGGNSVSVAARSNIGKYDDDEDDEDDNDQSCPIASPSPSVQPSPTPTPGTSPSPSPSASPSPTPSVSPSPSASPTIELENNLDQTKDTLAKLIDKIQELIDKLQNLL